MAYMYCEMCDSPFDYPTPQEAYDGNMECANCSYTSETCGDEWGSMLVEMVEDYQERKKKEENSV